jgi:hypothetical protein
VAYFAACGNETEPAPPPPNPIWPFKGTIVGHTLHGCAALRGSIRLMTAQWSNLIGLPRRPVHSCPLCLQELPKSVSHKKRRDVPKPEHRLITPPEQVS